MVDIVINNFIACVPVVWHEVTLRKAMALEALTDTLSDSLRDYFAVMFEPSACHDELSECQRQQLTHFYARVLALMGDMPLELCEHTDPDEVATFVERYLAHFIVSMIFEPLFEPQYPESFIWDGQELFVPQSGEDIAGVEMPLSGLSAEEFCGASDLYVADKVRFASLIVASLCRGRGESYSVQHSRKRAAGMAELPMSIVLEVFFCLERLIHTSHVNSRSYTPVV